MKATYWFLCVTLTATVATARPCRADAHSAEARASYEQGKTAYDAGAYADAARAFAAADALAPNTRVLEMAMASASRANDPILGMSLVERADARGLNAVADAGRDLYASRVGQVMAVCPAGAQCQATLDGAVLPARAIWATVGEHSADLEIDGVNEHLTVQVETGKLVEIKHVDVVVPIGPPPAPVPEFALAPAAAATSDFKSAPVQVQRARVKPIWFWGGASATAVLGIASAISGANTLALHDGLASNRSDADLADRGRWAETRTNVLLISTGVVAVATAAIAYFVFRPKEVSRGIAIAR